MEAQTRIPSPGAELISVRIGEQAYAIDIMAVREIRGWSAATPLPRSLCGWSESTTLSRRARWRCIHSTWSA